MRMMAILLCFNALGVGQDAERQGQLVDALLELPAPAPPWGPFVPGSIDKGMPAEYASARELLSYWCRG